MDVKEKNRAIRKYSMTFAYVLVGVSVALALVVILLYELLSYIIGIL